MSILGYFVIFLLAQVPCRVPQNKPDEHKRDNITMAYYSIEKRIKADGSPRYRCTVINKENSIITFRKNKTFSKLSFAKTWGIKIVAEIEQHGTPDPSAKDIKKITLHDLITLYINDPNKGGKASRDRRYVLNRLSKSDIADVKLSELRSHHFIEHCRQRAAGGAGPSTVGHDMSYLTSVLAAAKPIYNISITDEVAKIARANAIEMGLIGPSNRRTRRPIGDELKQLESLLKARSEHWRSTIPFVDILNFSILTCMRVGEVCKILKSDIDHNQRAVIVRDRKDPRKKDGNHMSVPLLGDAWHILLRQLERTDEKEKRIFPYKSASVSAGFHVARDKLGIQDLHYHDLRREGASRLLEQGFAIEEVARVTGHKNLQTLWQIYISIFPDSLHDRFDQLTAAK